MVAIWEQKIVGIIDFRPQLNEALANIGHIGYSTRPSERGKGIAKEMLRQVLLKAQACQLNDVTISFFHDNITSARVIMTSGGSYTGSFLFHGKRADRYQISLK